MPEHAAADGEQQALGQRLPEDVPPSRADRGADGDLARPRRGPRQQQVGDVRAGDEQHERRRRRAARTAGAGSRGPAPPSAEPAASPRSRFSLGNCSASQRRGAGERRARFLASVDARLEPPEHEEVVLVVLGQLLRGERDRQPQLLVVQRVVERRAASRRSPGAARRRSERRARRPPDRRRTDAARGRRSARRRRRRPDGPRPAGRRGPARAAPRAARRSRRRPARR